MTHHQRIDYCEHVHYKGIRKPRVQCPNCWRIWLANHPNEEVDSSDLLMVLLAADQVAQSYTFYHNLTNDHG